MWELILVSAIFLIAFRYLWTHKKKTNGREIPGPKGWPLIGNLLETPVDTMHMCVSDLAVNYGPILKINFLGSPIVVLNDAELVRKAFAADKYLQYMNDRPESFYAKYLLFGGQNISSINNGPLFSKMRSALIKALKIHGEGVEHFESDMSEELLRLTKEMSSKKGNNFEMTVYLKNSLTKLQSILLCSETIPDNDPDMDIFWDFSYYDITFLHPAIDGVLTSFPFLRNLPGYYGSLYKGGVRARDRVLKKTYYDLKKTHTPDNIRALADALFTIQKSCFEAGDTWCTDVILSCTLLDVAVGGLVATYSTISTFMLLMVHYPDIQKKIQQEIDDVIGTDRPTLKHRASMPYAEASIMETQRYLAPVAIAIPHICNADINFEGFDIQQGATVLANIWFIHHDESVWGDPWTFRPDRFLNSDNTLLPAKHPLRQKLMTFSVGRRQCPGDMFARGRLFLYATTLLQKFRFLPPTDRTLTSCDPRKFIPGFVVFPPEYMCRVEERQ